jgi:hypothetical protein
MQGITEETTTKIIGMVSGIVIGRDREWREWLERLKPKFGHVDSWARLELADPPPDRK